MTSKYQSFRRAMIASHLLGVLLTGQAVLGCAAPASGPADDASTGSVVADVANVDGAEGHDGAGGGSSDAASGDVAAPDVAAPDCPGVTGCPCVSPADCDEAICLDTPQGGAAPGPVAKASARRGGAAAGRKVVRTPRISASPTGA